MISSLEGAGLLCAGGSNLTAYNRLLHYRVLRNYSQSSAGSLTCVASTTWALSVGGLADVSAGELIEIKLWCANSAWLSWTSNPVSDGSGEMPTDDDAAAYAIALE